VNVTLLLVSALAAAAAFAWRAQLVRRRTIARLDGTTEHVFVAADDERAAGRRIADFPPRHRVAVAIVTLVAAIVLDFVIALPIQIAIAAAAVIAVLAHIVETAIAERRMQQIEMQLTEAIDLMVGSLRAGGALLASFETALREARPPLKPYLNEVVVRVRLGDDPKDAIDTLRRQIPLDGVRLFATSMAVNWEAGGSLATTLASVGRTIRDRIDLSRRIRTQGVEAHASVVVVMLVAYVLAFLMWRTNPERMEAFVKSAAGTDLVALVIGFQAAGLIWMTRLSRGDL
jgi:tight adherence protein B